FLFRAEYGIRDFHVTGVETCALPIWLVKVVKQKGKLKSSLVFDEFPTIYLSGIDSLIATARSNKVATTLGIQDLSQLRKDYGKEQADVIMGIVGNVVSGQVTGDTARQLSDRIGKIMQDRQSFSINSGDTSISKSKVSIRRTAYCS